MTYQIARRAFGKYETVEAGIADWISAVNRAMELQATNQDGEYFEFRDDEAPCSRPNEYCAVQDAFAYL